ncbi:MAG: flagellar basal body P-ring protein FlgI [Nitrospina sp.]|jgi:flagellar P-ring protein FlgI|nr:flagellar basal body P-ring protein FlgI [Nitrospina sp.]MBT3875608.1 flagellar basal body P-ring protein FlgI [Nitrospina sp.]MBT4047579.1 flagellar basal body P-ring protein FlgI [Nitrospina sp.]MBT4556217.1 flagellar basal body P-ring protein FlgI [Nitrospina sp.]MBT5348594.1 flagellar basal body P-ring protein FlgI [Nitrospina sp.]
MFKNLLSQKLLTIFILVFFLASPADSARIKDLSNIKGVRSNQLIGFGLVIGLTGTGDSATNVFFSIQTIVSMLKRLGVTVPTAEVSQLKFKNIATVIVTADLPPFAKQGDHIDVTVSSLGDSKSLQGGTLLMTPLKGPDGNTYAVAQGPLSIGGFSVSGSARGVQKNHLTVGRISNGAQVEKEIKYDFNSKEEIILALKTTDFTTASRISKAINDDMKDSLASMMNGGTVRVRVPELYLKNTSDFVTRIEKLDVIPDSEAKVIMDERTGTIVMGENVKISSVAVAHGALFINIKEEPVVSQPPPLAPEGAKTAILPRTRIAVGEGIDKLLVIPDSISLGDVVKGLNSIGVTPRDLIAILQAIKASGALHARLELI